MRPPPSTAAAMPRRRAATSSVSDATVVSVTGILPLFGDVNGVHVNRVPKDG
jgi:hypothetical protein